MILRSSLLATMVILSISVLPDAASADEAYIGRSDNLRSGPDYAFSSMRKISRGRTIDVFGCTNGYEWCDIEYRGDRGWFPGDNIVFYYDGRRTPLRWVAPLLSIVILEFSVDDYWGRYYIDRPWYEQRHRYTTWQMQAPRIFEAPPPQDTWSQFNALPPPPPRNGVSPRTRIPYEGITPYNEQTKDMKNPPFGNRNNVGGNPRVPTHDELKKKKFCYPNQLCDQ